ncbi:MAG TPA: hypothetical protein VI704_07360, partial [Bacteroidota bacterium]|nr:hypothetical protein [Bacteroidota bacterium]
MSEIIARTPHNLRDIRILLLVLSIVGVFLTLTAIPGIFIIDEDNYLVSLVALRHGRFTIPGTEGFKPSSELVYFDPEANHRIVSSTPVTSLAPPLYAFIALPFSVFGVRGLILLNILAFLITAFLVFLYA